MMYIEVTIDWSNAAVT